MKITVDSGDAPDFVALVERICSDALERYAPADFVLVKINNWFGSKWLGFSGKAVGALGVRHEADGIRIPPFVPNRVISQRRFSGHPAYNEVSGGRPIRKHIPSSNALQRKAALHLPRTAIGWSSGNTIASGRGAVMAYVPTDGSYWAWYGGWEKVQNWGLRESRSIKPEQLTQLIGTASIHQQETR
jgi:hypothetical protein